MTYIKYYVHSQLNIWLCKTNASQWHINKTIYPDVVLESAAITTPLSYSTAMMDVYKN